MLTALAEYRRERRTGTRKPSRWAVAFSGGADSLALLLVLWAEGPGRWGRNFVVLHFNHRLRGRAADADEKFCVQVCAALGVKCVTGRWRTARKGASEAEARAARFEFFAREMNRRKLRLLWLGHQQDDIAESMLMRLARGSGSAGLAAPRPAQKMPGGRWHLRPLLTLKKTAVMAALREAGAGWREDATNVSTGIFSATACAGRCCPNGGRRRSAMRSQGPPCRANCWRRMTLRWRRGWREVRPLAADRTLILGKLAGKPRALVRRALHRWLLAQPSEIRISRQAFETLLHEVISGRSTRQSLGREGFAVLDGERLRFAPAQEFIALIPAPTLQLTSRREHSSCVPSPNPHVRTR